MTSLIQDTPCRLRKAKTRMSGACMVNVVVSTFSIFVGSGSDVAGLFSLGFLAFVASGASDGVGFRPWSRDGPNCSNAPLR